MGIHKRHRRANKIFLKPSGRTENIRALCIRLVRLSLCRISTRRGRTLETAFSRWGTQPTYNILLFVNKLTIYNTSRLKENYQRMHCNSCCSFVLRRKKEVHCECRYQTLIKLMESDLALILIVDPIGG